VIHLRSIELRKESGGEAREGEDGWPFSVPAVAGLGHRSVESPVLFFVGENGSGKSTLLESLAIATRRVTVGAADAAVDPSLGGLRPLAARLRLGWGRQTARGFFLRAEDFFNFGRRNRETVAELDRFAERFRDDARVRGYMLGQKSAIEERYGGDLDALSHGESFLQLFKSRVVPGGFYLLDEPEAALSPKRQLALLSIIKQSIEEDDCQFVIATHSPILLSYPGATHWVFDERGIEEAAFEELEHVQFTRDFLQAPERYWRHL
jgi:predicted ATPase